MGELFPLYLWSIHHWSWWGDVVCGVWTVWCTGVPAENQPFNEGAEEVTVRGNVLTSHRPWINISQPPFQSKRAQPLPGVGGWEETNSWAVARSKSPHGTKTRETHELHDGATPTATAQLAGAAKMAPLGCPFVGAATGR